MIVSKQLILVRHCPKLNEEDGVYVDAWDGDIHVL